MRRAFAPRKPPSPTIRYRVISAYVNRNGRGNASRNEAEPRCVERMLPWLRQRTGIISMTRTRSSHQILVADDDAAIRALVAEVLKLEGYRVCTAEDGEE